MTALWTVPPWEGRGKNGSRGFHIQLPKVLPQVCSWVDVNKEAADLETRGSQNECVARLCHVRLHEDSRNYVKLITRITEVRDWRVHKGLSWCLGDVWDSKWMSVNVSIEFSWGVYSLVFTDKVSFITYPINITWIGSASPTRYTDHMQKRNIHT